LSSAAIVCILQITSNKRFYTYIFLQFEHFVISSGRFRWTPYGRSEHGRTFCKFDTKNYWSEFKLNFPTKCIYALISVHIGVGGEAFKISYVHWCSRSPLQRQTIYMSTL
jgi:hypothetical protein